MRSGTIGYHGGGERKFKRKPSFNYGYFFRITTCAVLVLGAAIFSMIKPDYSCSRNKGIENNLNDTTNVQTSYTTKTIDMYLKN